VLAWQPQSAQHCYLRRQCWPGCVSEDLSLAATTGPPWRRHHPPEARRPTVEYFRRDPKPRSIGFGTIALSSGARHLLSKPWCQKGILVNVH
jgi:hypothetical protein